MNTNLVRFNISCEMTEEWANVFYSFLKDMQRYGGINRREVMAFDCDGNGTFHPKFIFGDEFIRVSSKKPKNPTDIIADSYYSI